MDVGVVIAIYGDLDFWRPLARRALASAEAQDPPPTQIEYVEGASLHQARNEGLRRLRTALVCHLDGDDELEAGYFAALAVGKADIGVPAVRYVGPGRAAKPRMPLVAGHAGPCKTECLAYGNWIVIGALAPTGLLREIGGWRDFAWSEDYDIWVRAWKAGATFEAIPGAVYRAHVRRDSRNRAPDRAAKLAAHRAIAQANGLPIP